MTDLAHQLQATLAGRIEGKPKMNQTTDVKSMVEQVLEEQRRKARAQRLTWGPSGEVMTEDSSDRVGLWNRRMAYDRLCGYVIQNRLILRSNGTELPKLPDGQYDLSEISDEEQVWFEERMGRPTGVKRTQKSPRKLIAECYVRHCAGAISKDRFVCPIMADYRATDDRDLTKHIFHTHPAEFAEMVELDTTPAPGNVDLPAAPEALTQTFDAGAVAPSAEPSPSPAVPSLECCGQSFRSAYTLQQHQTGKAHKTALAG